MIGSTHRLNLGRYSACGASGLITYAKYMNILFAQGAHFPTPYLSLKGNKADSHGKNYIDFGTLGTEKAEHWAITLLLESTQRLIDRSL